MEIKFTKKHAGHYFWTSIDTVIRIQRVNQRWAMSIHRDDINGDDDIVYHKSFPTLTAARGWIKSSDDVLELFPQLAPNHNGSGYTAKFIINGQIIIRPNAGGIKTDVTVYRHDDIRLELTFDTPVDAYIWAHDKETAGDCQPTLNKDDDQTAETTNVVSMFNRQPADRPSTDKTTEWESLMRKNADDKKRMAADRAKLNDMVKRKFRLT